MTIKEFRLEISIFNDYNSYIKMVKCVLNDIDYKPDLRLKLYKTLTELREQQFKCWGKIKSTNFAINILPNGDIEEA